MNTELENSMIKIWAQDQQIALAQQTERIKQNLSVAINDDEMTFDEFSDLFEDRDPAEFI